MSGGNLALERSEPTPAAATAAPYRPRTRLALSLRWYLFALAGASMLPLLGLATLEASDAIGARQDQAKLQMRQLLADSAHGVEQGLASMTATAQALAISSALASGKLAAFRQEAQDIATARQIDVVLRDPSGAQLVATRVPPGAPPAHPPGRGPPGPRRHRRRAQLHLRYLRLRHDPPLSGAHRRAGGGAYPPRPGKPATAWKSPSPRVPWRSG